MTFAAPLACLSLSCDDSVDSPEQPAPIDSFDLHRVHLNLVAQWELASGDPPIDLCNGIDSPRRDTMYFSLWTKMKRGIFAGFSGAYRSEDTIVIYLAGASTSEAAHACRFGERLSRPEKRRADPSVGTLAEEVGMSKVTIYDWLQGARKRALLADPTQH